MQTRWTSPADHPNAATRPSLSCQTTSGRTSRAGSPEGEAGSTFRLSTPAAAGLRTAARGCLLLALRLAERLARVAAGQRQLAAALLDDVGHLADRAELHRLPSALHLLRHAHPLCQTTERPCSHASRLSTNHRRFVTSASRAARTLVTSDSRPAGSTMPSAVKAGTPPDSRQAA